MKSTSTNKAFEIVVITAEGSVSEEATTCNALMEAGLRKLHVRKPHASAAQVKTLIREIDTDFRDRLIVHEHHELVEEMNLGGYHIKSTGNAPEDTHGKHVSWSFHAFEEIQACSQTLNYGFLSPIFDSLSKSDYQARFSIESLKAFLLKTPHFPIFALGGISVYNVSSTKALGFKGAAVLGSIWQQTKVSDRLTQYQKLINQA
ncbi:MAG: thiamine phosphate synthase [Cytophagales bacterium]|nr:thiamine phosphate synthase [Cytophagales bacterium]